MPIRKTPPKKPLQYMLIFVVQCCVIELSERRASIVDALNSAIDIFTSHSDKEFERVISRGLKPIADATGLDRVVFYRAMDINGEKRIGQIYLWDKAKGGLVPTDDDLRVLPKIPVLEQWVSTLSNNGCVRIRESEMSEDEMAFLRTFGVKSLLIVPVFSHGEFWGGVALQNHTDDSYFDEGCSDLLFSAARLCANAIIRAEKTKNANEAIEELKRREKMSDVLNQMAVTFLSQTRESFEDMMSDGVKLIADVTDLDRMSVWRNFFKDDGLHSSQIYRWERKAGGTTVPIAGLEDVTFRELAPSWERILENGETINGPTRLQNEREANTLKKFGIVSIFAAPVFTNNFFWGMVLFEDHHNERYFEEEHIGIMKSAAFLCANTVIRAEMELNKRKMSEEMQNQSELLKVRLEQQELLSDISRSFISSGETAELVNQAIAKLGHYHEVSMVLILSLDYDTKNTSLAYHWTDDSIQMRLAEFDLFGLVKSNFPERLYDRATVPVLSCTDTASSKLNNFHKLSDVNVSAFICAPLYVEGRLWGLLSVEQCYQPRDWTENEKSFVAMMASTIAGAIMLDIYNSKLKDAVKKLTAASKAKSEFLSNMSHEMRTPMNAIINMTAIAKNASDIERKNYALDKIGDASTHLLGVINDILDMSKIEANKFDLAPVEFDFEKMLQRVVNVVNFRIEEKHQKLMVYVDKDIPKTLIGDDQRLSQVITNLLGNSVKFTPDNGTITLNTKFLGEENEICTLQISVTDTGIGISDEQKKRLFQSFQQAETNTARKYGGTGLGLSISKSIVEMMNGKIWLESEPGKGSTFAFTIQAKRGEDKKQNLRERTINWSVIRILAVDDDPDILAFFMDVAQRFNIHCDTAPGGEYALKLVEGNGNYNIYFIDWKMPGMDGIALTNVLKSKERDPDNAIIIMISAAEWTDVKDEAQKAGVDRFLSKPLFPSAVIDVMSECLGVERHQAENVKHDNDDFTGRRILLVEDVEINREIVLTLLEPTHLKIDCAENGVQAVKMFSEDPEKYEMIFMDVQMPEMDGYEATKQIRIIEDEWNNTHKETQEWVPIIAMTANVFKEDIENCLKAGMDDHVGKPLDFEVVMEKLRTYLK
jgi:signal transduction histidine kinase/DNA-binding response OmpR family regulator